jgi:hypothetical protein
VELKISVLASGAILLDGRPVELGELESALEQAKKDDGTVLYHRESAQGAPPAQALEVMQLVVKYRLPISFCSADFSDYIDRYGQSHPRTEGMSRVARTDPFEPHMPNVDLRPAIEEVFALARKKASGEDGPRGVVIVRPDRGFLVLPPPPESPGLAANAERMRLVIPSDVKRSIAVIASTGYTMANPAAPPSIPDSGRAIPFLGMLIGLSYIGHAVWVFEGQSSAIAAGCKDADLLLVDSAMVPFLANGWDKTAAEVMRNANILVQDRKTFRLLMVHKVGTDQGRIEFSK